MTLLLDILLLEQLEDSFRQAGRKGPINAEFATDPTGEGDPGGRGGLAVRIDPREGASLLVTARGIHREVDGSWAPWVSFTELVGYDWISRDLSAKEGLREEYSDRIFLLLRGAREVVLTGLGAAVYPLMVYLGKVLELRSRKLVLERLDPGTVEAIARTLNAAAEGPFFTDDELGPLLDQDRPSLQVVAAMWNRMNLFSPELGRTITGVLEMLLQRRELHPEAWGRRVGLPAGALADALADFRELTGADGGAAA